MANTFHGDIDAHVAIPAPQRGPGEKMNINIDGQKHKLVSFSTVPFAPDPDLVDRPAIAAWVRDKCAGPGARAALVGLGGVGKSQLALQYAHSLLDAAPQTFVFWVHASTQARFEEAYRDIADRLELPGRDDPKASVLRLVHDWLRDEANGRWVMVVDNVDDVETFFPSRQHQHQHQGDEADASAQIPLANYLPQSRNGALLVTSRSKDAASRLVGGYNKIKEVLAMDEGEGLQLLRNKLQDAPLEESAVGLLHALDCIPLAITQAAAYINQHGRMTVAGYLDEYRKSSKRRERLLSWDAGALRRDRSASNSVMATWQMSFEQIRHERRSAAELLSLMSFFKPQGIPESVLRRHSREAARGVGLEDNKDADSAFDEDLATLQAYSLVSMTADSDTCEMHALVQFCTRVWLSSFSEAERWQGEFIELMAREFPSGKYENWAKCQQLLPHIEPLFDTQPADEVALKAWARVLTNAAWYLRLRGNYEVAELTATKASAAAELIFGTDNEVTLTSWNELANILQDRGKYKHAESLHRRVLEEREKIFGPYNRSTVESVNNLANVLRIQGKYNEAEQLHRRALQWREEALGSNDPMTLKSMSNLATVLGAQNFNSESESLHQRALEGRELILGPLHLDTLESVNSLAVVTQDQGKYEKAEALYRMALEGRVQILGAQHPDVLSSVNNLATVLQLQGRYEEAEMLHRRALEGREKKLGERHPDTLTSVSNLATVLRDQGNHGEAESLVRKHHEPQSIFVGQASTASGTYIGQSSISFFQNETLVGQEEPTIILKEDAKIPGDSSVASHTTTGREKLGKAYIAHFLAADVEVGVLCCSMLDRVDQEQFVDIGEQMLKGYYLGLLECAKTELEKQGARLLKSGPGRRRICKDIADTIKDENAQNKEEKKRAAEQLRLTEERLEMFTKDSPDTYPDLDPNQPPELEGEFPTDYNDITQSKKQDTELDQEHLESELGSEDEDLPNLTRMKEFFRESEPFQVLLNDLRIQLLPHSLRDIMQTAPHGFLSLSNQDNHSLSNRMKAFIEDFTMLEWNWWPLEPRMRNLNSNETRLFWHCSCGTRLWQEISWDDANLIKPMLSNRTTGLASPRCRQNRGLTSLVAKYMAFAAPPSAAGQRYTPPTAAGSSSSATQGSQSIGASPATNNLINPTHPMNQMAGSMTNTNMGQRAISSDPRILFGVKGPNPAFKLEQIEIKNTTNDSNFYDELRKHYRLNRGKFRYWFSFWRLGYCEVVKFQAYRPDYVLKEHKELPTGDDYDYLPRHPEAQNPPVSQHEFSMHLNACGDDCRWTLLNHYVPTVGSLLHECLPRLNTTRAIKRIPKKKSPFDTSSTDDKNAYAWGLEARHEISAAYVAFYHLLILALPFSFWGWWQARHPGDLQNASVPVTIVLTMLSLFWGTNGILTQGRKLDGTGI